MREANQYKNNRTEILHNSPSLGKSEAGESAGAWNEL